MIAALVLCWTVLGMPAGKRLAPLLGELVVLRRFGELDIDDDTAALLSGMSAATIDRRLAPERKKYAVKGRSRTKPGTLLRSQIPIRTWADWDDAVPGFVEIDLVGHDGGNLVGEHGWTLTVTDIATGWTEDRSVLGKALNGVMAALVDIAAAMPFPIRGLDSDNGSEFINFHLLDWYCKHQITFTRTTATRSGSCSPCCSITSTPNRNWFPRSATAAKVTKKHDIATTPHNRAQAHPNLRTTAKADLTRTYLDLNPAALQRQIHALLNELLTLAITKAGPRRKASPAAAPANPTTNHLSRASGI